MQTQSNCRTYTIFSIDNSRRYITRPLKRRLSGQGWTRVETDCVSAYVDGQLEDAIKSRDIDTSGAIGRRTTGEMGIWYTTLNGLDHAPVVFFQDDAFITDKFTSMFDLAMSELPEDADFFSLFIPRDKDHMFTEEYDLPTYRVCRIYANYGGVSMYWTPRGVEKLHALLRRDGIRDQYDVTLYNYSKAGELNGYTSKPTRPDIVNIVHVDSLAHNKEMFRGVDS